MTCACLLSARVSSPRFCFWGWRLDSFPVSQVREVKVQMQKEKEVEMQAQQVARGPEHTSAGGGGGGLNNRGWNEEDLQLLIKAVNLFPAGTNARWVSTDPVCRITHCTGDPVFLTEVCSAVGSREMRKPTAAKEALLSDLKI